MMEDRILLWRFKRGSRDALRRVYETYRTDLLKLAVSLVTDVDTAEDAVQNVFASFAQSAARMSIHGDLRRYLVACVANRIRNRRREAQRQEKAAGVEESRLIHFIVRAGERGNSEWGLPPWTPYPPIDSAAAEFTGAQLEIVTPAAYPLGLEIPVIARVESGHNRRVGVNGTITLPGFEKYPLRLLRGVGSVFLPAATEAGVIPCTAAIHSLSVPKEIVIEEATSWKTVAEDIATSEDWGENARIRITGGTDGALTIGDERLPQVRGRNPLHVDESSPLGCTE
jgi:DNA-directed RNA polymerase specialized sigma24 family protein